MTKILTVALAAVALAVFVIASLVLGGGSDFADGAATLPAPVTAPITAPVPATIAPVPVISVPDRMAVSSTPRVSVSGADSEDWTRLIEALATFSENGLELPDLEVRFFDDQSECFGHQGLFQTSFTPWRLLICSDLKFVPTHELAHAWEAANLTDDDRDRYVEGRRMTSWDDPDLAWDERAVEDLAFIVQQNLTATSPALTSVTWIERVDAYELATGRPSPLVTEG